MNKNNKNKIVKDYRYWQLHKTVFEELFWELDVDTRQSIASNPYCRESKSFEKKLEREVSERLQLTSV